MPTSLQDAVSPLRSSFDLDFTPVKSRPTLGWLEELHEVGPPITRFIGDEAEIQERIADLEKQIEARRADLKRLHTEVRNRVAKHWTREEIAEARARWSRS